MFIHQVVHPSSIQSFIIHSFIHSRRNTENKNIHRIWFIFIHQLIHLSSIHSSIQSFILFLFIHPRPIINGKQEHTQDLVYFHVHSSNNSSILHPFIHPASIHPSCIHSSILHLFIRDGIRKTRTYTGSSSCSFIN